MEDRKTLTVRLTPDELKAFKIALLEKDMSIQEYLYKCILDLIRQEK